MKKPPRTSPKRFRTDLLNQIETISNLLEGGFHLTIEVSIPSLGAKPIDVIGTDQGNGETPAEGNSTAGEGEEGEEEPKLLVPVSQYDELEHLILTSKGVYLDTAEGWIQLTENSTLVAQQCDIKRTRLSIWHKNEKAIQEDPTPALGAANSSSSEQSSSHSNSDNSLLAPSTSLTSSGVEPSLQASQNTLNANGAAQEISNSQPDPTCANPQQERTPSHRDAESNALQSNSSEIGSPQPIVAPVPTANPAKQPHPFEAGEIRPEVLTLPAAQERHYQVDINQQGIQLTNTSEHPLDQSRKDADQEINFLPLSPLPIDLYPSSAPATLPSPPASTLSIDLSTFDRPSAHSVQEGTSSSNGHANGHANGQSSRPSGSLHQPIAPEDLKGGIPSSEQIEAAIRLAHSLHQNGHTPPHNHPASVIVSLPSTESTEMADQVSPNPSIVATNGYLYPPNNLLKSENGELTSNSQNSNGEGSVQSVQSAHFAISTQNGKPEIAVHPDNLGQAHLSDHPSNNGKTNGTNGIAHINPDSNFPSTNQSDNPIKNGSSLNALNATGEGSVQTVQTAQSSFIPQNGHAYPNRNTENSSTPVSASSHSNGTGRPSPLPPPSDHAPLPAATPDPFRGQSRNGSYSATEGQSTLEPPVEPPATGRVTSESEALNGKSGHFNYHQHQIEFASHLYERWRYCQQVREDQESPWGDLVEIKTLYQMGFHKQMMMPVFIVLLKDLSSASQSEDFPLPYRVLAHGSSEAGLPTQVTFLSRKKNPSYSPTSHSHPVSPAHTQPQLPVQPVQPAQSGYPTPSSNGSASSPLTEDAQYWRHLAKIKQVAKIQVEGEAEPTPVIATDNPSSLEEPETAEEPEPPESGSWLDGLLRRRRRV